MSSICLKNGNFEYQPKHHIKGQSEVFRKIRSSICPQVNLDSLVPNVTATQWDRDRSTQALLLILRSIDKTGS